MRVTDVDVRESARGAGLSGTVVWDDRRRGTDRIEMVYRDVGSERVTTPGDALLAAILVTAVAVGEDIVMEAPVSQALVDSVHEIVDHFVRGVPGWHRIGVEAPTADRSGLRPTEVAATFSGGVDSFYTALRPRPDPISLLITGLGLDFEHLVPQQEPLMRRLTSVAHALGKKHLVVETNGYSIGRRHLSWRHPRGVAILVPLAIAQALGLGACVRRFHVAATRAPDELRPGFIGTSPDVDPLWSTESLEVVHDGLAQRLDKVRAIASSAAVQQTLQVCMVVRPTVDNCNRCDKCVATALALELAGAIDSCRTLRRVTPSTVRRTTINPNWVHAFTHLRDETTDPRMRRAITFALQVAALRRPLRPIGAALRSAGLRRGKR